MAPNDTPRDPASDDGRHSPRPRLVYARTYAGMTIDDDRHAGDDAAVLWRIFRLAARRRVRLALAVSAVLAAAMFQLLIPQYLGDAVDGAVGLLGSAAVSAEEAREALYHTFLMLLGVSALRGLFTLIHNYCGETLGHHLAYRLRLDFYDKLQHLNFSFHDRVHTGELITRGMLDLEGVRSFMNTGPLRVLLLSVLIGAGAWLLLSTDWSLGALGLSFVPFVAWRSTTVRLRLREMWLALQERMAVLGRIMDENLTGIRVVRAFGAEPHELDKYQAASDHALSLAARRIRTRVSASAAMNLAFLAAMGLVLWVGGARVIDGRMTVGTLTEFLAFMTILQQPVRQLGMVTNSFARASICGARLFAVLDLDPAIRDREGARAIEVTHGVLEFEDVSFAYPGGEASPVLREVSFRVERGKTLGIVGPPGSGKSTIAHLVPAPLRRGRRTDHGGRPGHPRRGRSIPCAGRCAWCNRTRSCSPPRSGTTSPTATRGPRTKPFATPPPLRTSTVSSTGCRKVTRRWWANGACRCRAGRNSGWPSRAPPCCGPRSSCSTTPRPPSTPAPSSAFATRSGSAPTTAPPSSRPTASGRCATPTRSSSSRTGAWWNGAPMTRWWPWTGSTPRCFALQTLDGRAEAAGGAAEGAQA